MGADLVRWGLFCCVYHNVSITRVPVLPVYPINRPRGVRGWSTTKAAEEGYSSSGPHAALHFIPISENPRNPRIGGILKGRLAPLEQAFGTFPLREKYAPVPR